ncbi:VOC family protein [Mesorhizobium sp.]|uniref:VOC family protein n=1 Tax=Mesorhizobium sp. TaxID=1871066 RepID=UPI000FE35BE6|nr:VOC family protein [Mesorhizobium sp.]RWA69658.1 MAG: VOC family protein [Mesorhizobium sp.]RWB98455.1 MAG: VOC family protein [Mesorhizobium sp.]RWG83519.1 MAG: VOC family protein [Mesorhizobium sp.]RWG87521.1 MAG: VOC family protein [Mesorhizobium sp.]RWK11598.1 MAG: VOC family protein [Mesorhizobium sp.]
MATVHPFLWFNLDAEQARDFYLSVFKNGRARETITLTDNVAGTDTPHAIFDFELEGQRFTALNAGGVPPFNERISLYIETRDQAETDYYWNALTAGGGAEKPCGWLQDKFGVYWQVIPEPALRLMNDPDREKAARARQAMYSMRKIILADIEAAHAGRA